MATHPVESDDNDDRTSDPPAQPNTSRLPIEPEFQPEVLPAEPEDPASHPQSHPPH